MSKFVHDSWNVIMNSKHNPLRNIPDMNTRHLVMQLLAWMWCIIFSMYIGSITVFGISALLHSILIAGIVITVATFEVARKRPQYFGGLGRGIGGEHE